MSQENVKRLVEVREFFNRYGASPESADPDALQSFFRLLHPGASFEPQIAGMHGTYEGHDGVRRWLTDMAEHYTNVRMDYDEVRDVEDRVLALGTFRITGKGSGIEMEGPMAIVASFQDGLLSDLKDYGDRAQALEAVGLSE